MKRNQLLEDGAGGLGLNLGLNYRNSHLTRIL
jgi:hypothetical protein